MKELNHIQYQIIRSLTFAEPFETLMEEVEASEPVIVAELRTLIDSRYVQVMVDEHGNGQFRNSFYYDADNMRDFRYVATSRGQEMHDVYQQQ
ncbi:MAG: hypothetical protein AAGN35_08290 [Bacteroidota bacterium]